eukprot:TRINITY_DN46999_c0_g1_i1.p1 TRINITY_DN46999_c0_g1~~TRINITY_DN46999_c0_g1_i1.p1  ORF type:complete len:170 (+),score=61.27 TRINITY_DN46999_c0_g1_i1:108-617(+)
MSAEDVSLVTEEACDGGEETACSCGCCCGVELQLTRADRRMFLMKTALVVVVTFALFPLIRLKSSVPKLTFTILLVALHLVVLVVYFYRVKLRSLDPDCRSVAARVAALLIAVGLLFLAARQEHDTSDLVLVLEMCGLCAIHTAILALLLVRVRYGSARQHDCGNNVSA